MSGSQLPEDKLDKTAALPKSAQSTSEPKPGMVWEDAQHLIFGPSTTSRAIEPEERDETIEEKTPRKKRWLIPVSILSGVLVVVLIMVGIALAKVNDAIESIGRDPDLTVTDDPNFPTTPDSIENKPINFVVMGSDSRGPDQGRSDVLLIAHLTEDRQKMYLISFPRDIYVEIPGHGKNKINAAYALGGPALAVKTLQNLTQVKMDHTVLIDFEDFIMVTKKIGGITFNNRVASSSQGATFPKGKITLAGEDLLKYVRQRHGLPNGDLDRTERHRTVLRAVFLKLATPETLANPVAIVELLDTVGSYFTVDASLTNSEVVAIASSMKISSGADIVSMQAPISGYGRSPANASIDIINEPQMAELSQALQGDTLDAYVAKYGTASGLTKK